MKITNSKINNLKNSEPTSNSIYFDRTTVSNYINYVISVVKITKTFSQQTLLFDPPHHEYFITSIRI